MKTEMQDLIEIYNKDIVKLKEDFKQTTSIIIAREISTLEHVVTNLESRLVKEKQQIVDSYNKGKSNGNTVLCAVISEPKKIETYADLPEYGKYVLVSGIDKMQYDVRRWHVCEMNDLEDGLDYRDKGQFLWLTEKGTKIEEVTHWCELPTLV